MLERAIITSSRNCFKTSSPYSLTLTDIQIYAELTRPATKGESSYDITEIKDETGETIFFVLQEESGWKLLASDMRIFPIVASNDEGRFDEDVLSDASVCTWLKGMEMDMKTVKNTVSEGLKLSEEEIKSNIEYWNYLLGKVRPELTLGSETKHPPLIPPGNFVLVSSVQEYIPYDSIPHLTSTYWSEYFPYNDYCPYISYISGLHAPAGSVSIAGSQLLYYLHYKDGIPAYAPSSASVACTVDSLFQLNYMYQGNLSSTIWDEMVYTPSSAAPLIASIGKLVITHYEEFGASADVENLVDALELYSIASDFSDYSSSLVSTSLLSGYPVVATGATNRSFWGNYSGYHTFLIDAYIRYQIKTTNVYTWVYLDNGYEGELPSVDDETIITYGPPYVKYVKMNWGRGYNSNNNINFALTDEWVYNNGNTLEEYQYDRSLIVVQPSL